MASYFLKKLLKLWYLVFDSPLSSPSLKEKQCIDELRRKILTLPCDLAVKSSGAEEFLVKKRSQIRNLVLHDDPRQFLRWEPVVSTMYVGDAKEISQELDHLKKSVKWSSRWKRLARELPAGHPKPSALFPGRSGNVIHHAYHLCRLEEETGVDIEELTHIIEFGGGYGNLCRLAYEAGFKGRYLICDLPELSALQAFYLQLTNVSMCSIESSEGIGVSTVSNSQSLKSWLPIRSNKKTAFFATWSMSETSVSKRKDLVPVISKCDVVLIGYQETFCDVDNVEYFAGMKQMLGDSYRWSDKPIKHLPGNRYLVGAKADPKE